MTKQEFIIRFEAIKAFYEQQQELANALHKHLLKENPAVTFGNRLMVHYVAMLSELSGIPVYDIEYLLYQGPSELYDADGNPFNVITAEDLWDSFKTT